MPCFHAAWNGLHHVADLQRRSTAHITGCRQDCSNLISMTGSASLLVLQCSSRMQMQGYLFYKVLTQPHAVQAVLRRLVILQPLSGPKTGREERLTHYAGKKHLSYNRGNSIHKQQLSPSVIMYHMLTSRLMWRRCPTVLLRINPLVSLISANSSTKRSQKQILLLPNLVGARASGQNAEGCSFIRGIVSANNSKSIVVLCTVLEKLQAENLTAKENKTFMNICAVA
jgi:hypothetical protein